MSDAFGLSKNVSGWTRHSWGPGACVVDIPSYTRLPALGQAFWCYERLLKEDVPVCRAGYKFREVFERFPYAWLNIEAAMQYVFDWGGGCGRFFAVDIGSSPGGWTTEILRRFNPTCGRVLNKFFRRSCEKFPQNHHRILN